MDLNLLKHAEQVEAAMQASRTSSATDDVATDLGLSLFVDDGVVGNFISTIDALSLNRVVGLGIKSPASERQIDRLCDTARAKGVRRLFLQVAPFAEPADLPQWLEARGAKPYNRWTRVIRRAEAPLPASRPTDFDVREVGEVHAAEFAAVVRAGFGMPPTVDAWLAAAVGRPDWYHSAAWRGNTMVATGALFVVDRIGWIGFAATATDARGQGAQTALIAHRIRQAAILGCEWVVAETAEDTPEHRAPSFHNMRRLGFELAYFRRNYVIDLTQPPG